MALAYIFNISCIISSCSLKAGYEIESYTCSESLDFHAKEAALTLISHVPLTQDVALSREIATGREIVTANLQALTAFNDCLKKTKKMQLFKNNEFLNFIAKQIQDHFLGYCLFDRDRDYLYILIDLVYTNLYPKKSDVFLYTDVLRKMVLHSSEDPCLSFNLNEKCSRKITAVLIPCIQLGCSLYGDVFKTIYIQNLRYYYKTNFLDLFVDILDEELIAKSLLI